MYYFLLQKVACECIIAAASKKNKVKSIIDQGAHILKKLYTSKKDAIRVSHHPFSDVS
jgi:hypothetical protein